MSDLVTALGLVLVFEGLLYAAFPAGIKNMMAGVMGQPDGSLRGFGIAAMVIGVGIVWLVRG